MSQNNARPPLQRRGALSLVELGLGFFQIGLLGFGGVASWSRRIIVEERKWMSDADYAAVLGVGQILPGANTANAAVIIGERFQGPLGSVTAVTALMAAPLAILIAAALLYDRYAALPDVRAALTGVAAAAAGLVIGTAVKMARGLPRHRNALGVGAAAFAAVAVFGVSLIWTVLVLAPLSLLLAFKAPGR